MWLASKLKIHIQQTYLGLMRTLRVADIVTVRGWYRLWLTWSWQIWFVADMVYRSFTKHCKDYTSREIDNLISVCSTFIGVHIC